MRQDEFKSGCRINKVDVTGDTLTGRGGMALYVRYLSETGIYPILSGFSLHKQLTCCTKNAGGCYPLRRSKKGLPVWNIFKQVFCFFYDKTSRHLTYFDQLEGDAGYAAVIENSAGEMASSHQIKRFFKSFSRLCGGVFRKVLKRLFMWRLKVEQPQVIELTIDTMVMDNDEAALAPWSAADLQAGKRVSTLADHLAGQSGGCDISRWEEAQQLRPYGSEHGHRHSGADPQRLQRYGNDNTAAGQRLF